MDKRLFKKALEFYRGEDYIEEIETDKKDRYLFFDEEDGTHYALNYTKDMNICDFIKDIKLSDCAYEPENDYSMTNIDKLFNLSELRKVLSMVNPNITMFLNEIVIAIDEDSLDVVEKYASTDLDGYVGKCINHNASIAINMYGIFNHFRESSLDEDEFFHNCVAEFYVTLLHELGHNYARENMLDIKHTLLEKYMTGKNTEEEVVELYARDIFDDLDLDCDVFKPFNRAFIEAKLTEEVIL